MIYREAELYDLAQIVHLLADDPLGKQREQAGKNIPQFYIDAFHNIKNDKNSMIYVACDENDLKAVIGCFQITYTQYLSRCGSKRATIESVRVKKTTRNNGVGTQMLNFAIAEAKKNQATIIQLTTDKTRTDAKRFYERIGFKDTHNGMKLEL